MFLKACYPWHQIRHVLHLDLCEPLLEEDLNSLYREHQIPLKNSNTWFF